MRFEKRSPDTGAAASGCQPAAGENGEGGDRGAGLGVSRRRRSSMEKNEKKEEEVAGFE